MILVIFKAMKVVQSLGNVNWAGCAVPVHNLDLCSMAVLFLEGMYSVCATSAGVFTGILLTDPPPRGLVDLLSDGQL